MAELMPWISGLLAAFAAWEWPFRSVSHNHAGAVPGSDDGMVRYLVEAAHIVGGWLPAGARDHRFVLACAHETVRLVRPIMGSRRVDDQAGAGLLIMLCGISGVVGAVVALSLAGALVGATVPLVVVVRGARASKRAQAQNIEEAMPEAFHGLSISLGSGHSLAQALRFVGNHAQEPVRTEFTRAACALACGVPARDAFDELLRRLPAPGLDLVACALAISQRTGAPLQGLLEQASAMVGERLELARTLEVKTAQARLSARLVACMPLVLIAALTLLSPDFRDGLATPVGAGSVALALTLDVIALIVIHRIMEVHL